MKICQSLGKLQNTLWLQYIYLDTYVLQWCFGGKNTIDRPYTCFVEVELKKESF